MHRIFKYAAIWIVIQVKNMQWKSQRIQNNMLIQKNKIKEIKSKNEW